MGIKIGDIDASYFKVGSSDCKIYLGDTLLYPKEEHDYSHDYFTIVSEVNDNVISMRYGGYSTSVTISASTDAGETWTEFVSTNSDVTIATLNLGDKLLIKGENSTYGYQYNRSKGFGGSGNFHVEGNSMSLLYGDNFVGKTVFPTTDPSQFCGMFSGTSITSAENLILPAETVYGASSRGSYNSMFAACTNLQKAPKVLPATTVGNSSYSSMFEGCTSLTDEGAPTICATTADTEAFRRMFMMSERGSVNAALTKTVPMGNVTFVGRSRNSCQLMYAGNASLVSAELLSTSLASSCYSSMFQNCTSLTTAPQLPATSLASSCYNSMFNGCTSLTTAPQLPATSLASGCYSSMFYGCSDLNRIECNADTYYSSATAATYNWVSGVAASGTFYKNSSNTWWTTGTSGIPTNWTVVNYTS